MKFRRQGIVILMCLLTTSLLVGCKVMDDQQREDRLKELLRDKYGEEFEVREMYVTGGVEAWCYPVDNPDVIFTIETTLDMDNISADDYLQTIVELQINNKVTPLAENKFGKSLVSANIPLGATTDIENSSAKDICLEKLLEYIHENGYSDHIFITVFCTSSDTNQEYDFIKEIGKMYQDGEIPYVNLEIYFLNNEYFDDAQEAINLYGWNSIGSTEITDIYDVLKEQNSIMIHFYEDGIPYVFDEQSESNDALDIIKYQELRRGIIY